VPNEQKRTPSDGVFGDFTDWIRYKFSSTEWSQNVISITVIMGGGGDHIRRYHLCWERGFFLPCQCVDTGQFI